MNAYRWCIRPLLFHFDPERTHHPTLRLCNTLGRSVALRSVIGAAYAFSDARLRTTIAGIDFANPVGLAAGFDKNGMGLAFFAALARLHRERLGIRLPVWR